MSAAEFVGYKTICVLILEDSDEDAELMIYELEKNGFIVDSRVVKDEGAYIHQLATFHPDIVLADYNLPLITGLEALTITIHSYPDLPFVFVTGTVGEEIAAETILNGASGLVLKKNLSRLPDVVKQALLDIHRHRRRRIEAISTRIQNRILNNMEALNRLREFLKRESPSSEWSEQLNDTLTDLNDMHRDLTQKDD